MKHPLSPSLTFDDITETVRESLLVLGPDLRVQRANRSFYRTFNVAPRETEGRLVYELGNGQWAIPALRKLLEEVLPQNTAFDDFEVAHDFPSIGRKVMLLNARRVHRDGGNDTEAILLAIEDVTERRRVEDERRELETRFTSLVKNVRDHSIFTLDPQGRITSWNVAAESILKFREDEALGRHFSIIFTDEDQRAGVPEWELTTALRDGRAEDERWHVRNGGERFWALGIVTPTHDATGNHTGFSKILRDITDRKRAEEQLHALNQTLEKRVAERTRELTESQQQLRLLVRELARTEQRERQRLATDLHDNLAQLLAVCKIKASAVHAMAPEGSTLANEVGAIKEFLGDGIGYTRTLMADLRPDLLNGQDLVAGVEWLAQRMEGHGLRVHVGHNGQPAPMDADMLGMLFQCVRELLYNVVKHAKTNEVTVTVERTGDTLRVIVADEGVGFDPAKRKLVPSENGGFGLFSIRERLGLLGGSLEIESAEGKGTTVTLVAPLRETRDHDAADETGPNMDG